jgi:hypothetical protein
MFSHKMWAAAALAASLAFTHYLAYKSGRAVVRNAWDAEKIAILKQAKDAEHENRKIESRRAQNVRDALQASAVRAKTLQSDAGAVRDELERLRNDTATARLQLPGSTSAACVAAADTTSQLLNYCAAALADVAAKADGHANDSLTMQQAWPR